MPVLHLLHSCNRRFSLWLTAALLCSLSVAVISFRTPVDGCSATPRTESLAPSDGWHRHMLLGRQAMPVGIAVSAKSGERIGNSRPVRLTPTSGGKSFRMLGRWSSVNSIHLSHLYSLLLQRCDGGVRAWAASSRLYYVIALRRILC